MLKEQRLKPSFQYYLLDQIDHHHQAKHDEHRRPLDGARGGGGGGGDHMLPPPPRVSKLINIHSIHFTESTTDIDYCMNVCENLCRTYFYGTQNFRSSRGRQCAPSPTPDN